MDILSVQGLQVQARIGVHAWEQRITQPLTVDISIAVDVSLCDDVLEHVLNYDSLCQQVSAQAESQHFQLIETLANTLAEFIKKTYQLSQVTVTVNKPQAVKNAKNIAITVTR